MRFGKGERVEKPFYERTPDRSERPPSEMRKIQFRQMWARGKVLYSAFERGFAYADEERDLDEEFVDSIRGDS